MTTLSLDDSQRLAVELVRSAPVGVVTGGPGTGKTTTLRAALDVLDALPEPATWPCALCLERGCDACEGRGFELGERYLLCSPTGKAARRMQEATGRPASTVHRALQYHPQQGWRRHAERPIPSDLIVVDESSMLDVELAAALLRAVSPTRTRVVFVGDANQLPSVGPGRVFADLIDSGEVPVARLTTLHRAAAESWVCTQAPAVLAGQEPDLTRRDDFEWRRTETADAAADAVIEVVRALPVGEDAQILIPQRKGSCGIDAINARLQALTNPPRAAEERWAMGGFELRPRDRVIQTKNDYTLGVMNGEVGEISSLEPKRGDEAARAVVRFDDRSVVYSRAQAMALELAYALTIHRSQGSEWGTCVVVCHSSHAFMLSRSLLYTAITRAKKRVVLVGDAKGLAAALRSAADHRRNTTLAERMKEAANAR